MSIAASPSALQPEDYDEIEAAVMETARGRGFLREYARRARAVEAEGLRTILARIEARLDALGAPPRAEQVPVVERLQTLVWTLREGGVDDFVCGKIEALAREIAAHGVRGDVPATVLPEALPQDGSAVGADAACDPVAASGSDRDEIKIDGAAPPAECARPAPPHIDEAGAGAGADAARIADSAESVRSVEDASADQPPPAIDPRLEALLWLDGLPILDRMAIFA